ncbi:MAG: Rab family GTPase [Promethearchaeia archaeon]
MSYRGKVILLGSPMVGKTSLLARFVDDQFSDEYNQTIGANFLIKEMNLKNILNKHSDFNIDQELKDKIIEKGFRLYFWDLGGQSDKLFVTEYYFLQALGAMVVFDLSNKGTFEELDFWISKMRELSGDIPFIIVGNKLDLEDQREVSDSEIEEIIDKYDVKYFDASAKFNENVDKAFKYLAMEILDHIG